MARMGEARPRAIDCWLNPPSGFADYRPEFLVRVARDYFKREAEMFTATPLDELLRQMDEAGVERAILTIDGTRPEVYDEIREACPGRFIASAFVDPTKGMEAVRLVESLDRLLLAAVEAELSHDALLDRDVRHHFAAQFGETRQAAFNEQKAGVVEAREVARDKPLVAKNGARLFFVAEITAEHIRPAHGEDAS
jgi:hypothetical protein